MTLLVRDERARLVVMPQITTDGLWLYEAPIAVNFGPAVPYMQTVKNFSARPGRTPESEKFAVPRGVYFIKKKRAVYGAPDPAKATTYAIERSNLNARQWNSRLRRRTLAFSKKLTRHMAAVALHYVHVNLCHIARNMRVTAAMAANVTDHVWSLEELMVAALSAPEVEAPEPKPLAIPRPEGPARELPGNRGFKVVDGGKGPVAPSPSPATPPVAPDVATVAGEVATAAPVAPVQAPVPAVTAPVTSAAPDALPGQLDLFGWRPKPRGPVQLSLFGEAPQG